MGTTVLRVRQPALGTGLLALVLAAGVIAPAVADPDGPGTPSASDVREAQDRADAARTDVDRVRELLAEADATLDAATIRAARAAEAWNGARLAARQARAEEKRAVAASVRADRALRVQAAAFRDVLITTDGSGDAEAANAILAAEDMRSLLEDSAATERVNELLDQQRAEYDAAAGAAEEAEADATAAAKEAVRALGAARAARDTARAEADAAAATATRIARHKTRLVARLARLQGVSIAVAQRRQDALEDGRRAARAATPVRDDRSSDGNGGNGGSGGSGGSGDGSGEGADPQPDPTTDPAPADPAPEDPPAPAGGAQAAIAFARAQLGEPYRWGAAGPDAWDCSGLTSRAWAAGGKSLPHYSVAQYDAATPISAGQLRPGDLVFWSDGGSPSSIFHVALYSGNGQIIHAPRTGRPVTEESMYYWRTPDFFARP